MEQMRILIQEILQGIDIFLDNNQSFIGDCRLLQSGTPGGY
jgi:hypothetical protein